MLFMLFIPGSSELSSASVDSGSNTGAKLIVGGAGIRLGIGFGCKGFNLVAVTVASSNIVGEKLDIISDASSSVNNSSSGCPAN